MEASSQSQSRAGGRERPFGPAHPRDPVIVAAVRTAVGRAKKAASPKRGRRISAAPSSPPLWSGCPASGPATSKTSLSAAPCRRGSKG
ncbi:hypothetical protein PACILC2_20090 [Paenibacillus cisolokensis]|uniref:Thiolase N-terminal domain-containing protein n=1 Tax=Paenibacillus cisolokensis TaxID=1658519 RepID=A0ABQ4N5L6_9BACL|nr:hypothetical protein PACILC2_20090 [Paenibacillus cisolokensis]